MNALVILLVAVAAAAPVPDQIVSVTQDTLGNYDLKYALHHISRAEHRDQHGLVSGGYSYIDPHGVLRKTIYTAGEHGFHAIGTDIPLPVRDTPDVALAKEEHLALLRAAHPIPVAVIEVPVAPPTTILEVPAVPAVKSVPIEVIPTPAVKSVPVEVVHIAKPIEDIPVPALKSGLVVPVAPVEDIPVGVVPESPHVLEAEGKHFTAERKTH